MEQLEDALLILIADDNTADRLILKSVIVKQGYDVITAVDGLDAIEKYKEHKPQIVLMDALMPRMDGFEAARKIKDLAGEDLIPIIFLTSLNETDDLVACLDAGGDDFLNKPYNKTILRAKINAFNRMRIMHKSLKDHRNKIAQHNEHMLWEQETAKEIFDNIAHAGALISPNIKYHQSPYAVFNGDVLVGALKPSGGLHLLLGDFTGHGLPAAIGAMPLSEIFYSMTSKGFTLEDILSEINLRLKKVLPTGCFCCAAMADVSFDKKRVRLWLGGLPDCYLLRNNGVVESFSSSHLPLGVVSNEKFDPVPHIIEMNDNDRLYLWSDGVIESENRQGELFGEERLKSLFFNVSKPEALFEHILDTVVSYCGQPSDDLTLLELKMVESNEIAASGKLEAPCLPESRYDATFEFDFRADTLKNHNPVPLIMQAIMEVPALIVFHGKLYTILTELYSNALEHGVLGLESSLKVESEGFSEYYRLRQERLDQLITGSIHFRLDYESTQHGGTLVIYTEDSGQGFDYKSLPNKPSGAKQLSGRGIKLLQSLCDSVEYIDSGNKVKLAFSWRADDLY